jgi:hypothetical protein
VKIEKRSGAHVGLDRLAIEFQRRNGGLHNATRLIAGIQSQRDCPEFSKSGSLQQARAGELDGVLHRPRERRSVGCVARPVNLEGTAEDGIARQRVGRGSFVGLGRALPIPANHH